MTNEEAIQEIINLANSLQIIQSTPTGQALLMAIKSLEAWEKVEKEINESILICREHAQNNNWYDGELAGFLQSKDIINENLAEVSE